MGYKLCFFSVSVSFCLQFSTKMATFAGKYSFVSQDKFDDYLKAAGIGMIKRKVLTNTTPDVVIAVNGNHFKIDTITSVKTINVEFDLDPPYEHDPGTGEVGKYVTSMEGNVMVTKKAGTDDVIAKREFSDTGFVMTMYAKGVSGTRTFKKA